MTIELKQYYARSTVYINSVYPPVCLVGLSLIIDILLVRSL